MVAAKMRAKGFRLKRDYTMYTIAVVPFVLTTLYYIDRETQRDGCIKTQKRPEKGKKQKGGMKGENEGDIILESNQGH